MCSAPPQISFGYSDILRQSADKILWPRHQMAAAFAAAFGILAGLVQGLGLGLLRWVVLVPSLGASNADATTIQAIFDAFHLYVGIGEHFGYLFTAL